MLRIYERDTDRLVLRDHLSASTADQPAPAQWYDLLKPSASEVSFIETALGLSLPTRDEMEEIELSARLYQEDGAEFMTMTALTNLDGDAPSKTPVTFILKGNQLVTVRYAEAKPFLMFAGRAMRSNGQNYASARKQCWA